MEQLLGYKFADPNLLQEALYAGDPTNINGRYLAEANKPLAIFGDAGMDLVIDYDGHKASLTGGTRDLPP